MNNILCYKKSDKGFNCFMENNQILYQIAGYECDIYNTNIIINKYL